MDKFRAIEYFNRAAEAGSFAGAARSLNVSTAAVTQLIAALERSLGSALFYRTSRGVSLTPGGQRYYEVSRTVTDNLQAIEQGLGVRAATPRGTLTVGMRSAVGQNCVMPHIARFISHYPQIEVVAKLVETLEAVREHDFDVAVMSGWPPSRDFVVRPLAATRLLVCASPAYWEKHGQPDEPDSLREHHCLVFRGAAGTLLDRWTFERDGERRSVDVRGNLVSEHRTWLDEAACAGAGVIRVPDVTIRHHLTSGALLPTLHAWTPLEAPTVYAAYRRQQRRSKLVRLFIDFLIELFAEFANPRDGSVGRLTKPEWFGRARGRQSAYVPRKRGRRP